MNKKILIFGIVLILLVQTASAQDDVDFNNIDWNNPEMDASFIQNNFDQIPNLNEVPPDRLNSAFQSKFGSGKTIGNLAQVSGSIKMMGGKLSVLDPSGAVASAVNPDDFPDGDFSVNDNGDIVFKPKEGEPSSLPSEGEFVIETEQGEAFSFLSETTPYVIESEAGIKVKDGNIILEKGQSVKIDEFVINNKEQGEDLVIRFAGRIDSSTPVEQAIPEKGITFYERGIEYPGVPGEHISLMQGRGIGYGFYANDVKDASIDIDYGEFSETIIDVDESATFRTEFPFPKGLSIQFNPDRYSNAVEKMQMRLNELGYKDDSGNPLSEDGHFGQKTKQAVANMQRDLVARTKIDSTESDPKIVRIENMLNQMGYKDSKGQPLPADGLLDKQTIEAIEQVQRSLGRGYNKNTEDLQNMLKDLGYKDQYGQELKADGYRGSRTDAGINAMKQDLIDKRSSYNPETFGAVDSSTIEALNLVYGPDVQIISGDMKFPAANAFIKNNEIFYVAGSTSSAGTRINNVQFVREGETISVGKQVRVRGTREITDKKDMTESDAPEDLSSRRQELKPVSNQFSRRDRSTIKRQWQEYLAGRTDQELSAIYEAMLGVDFDNVHSEIGRIPTTDRASTSNKCLVYVNDMAVFANQEGDFSQRVGVNNYQMYGAYSQRGYEPVNLLDPNSDYIRNRRIGAVVNMGVSRPNSHGGIHMGYNNAGEPLIVHSMGGKLWVTPYDEIVNNPSGRYKGQTRALAPREKLGTTAGIMA